MESLIPLILLAVGLFLLIKGVRLRMGYEKWRYFSSWSRAGSIGWMALPGGLALTMWGLAFVPGLLFGVNATTAGLGLLILISSLVVFFVGVLFTFIQPNFIKPRWLKWLYSEHKDIMPLLRREAQEMGLNVWEERVKTQEGLEQWVAEVRRKHGL
jgi:hypothetical protein